MGWRCYIAPLSVYLGFFGAFMKVCYTSVFIIFFSALFNVACSSHQGEGDDGSHLQLDEVRLSFYLVSAGKADSTLPQVNYMGQSLQLRQPAIIGNGDVAAAELHSPTSIYLELTPEGGERLFESTRENIGHQMLIMLDDEVVNVATIQMGLRANMVITGLNEQQLSKLLITFTD